MSAGSSIELRGLEDMIRTLDALSRRYVPAAARDAINTLAWGTRTEWQRQMADKLTLRNTFTQRRVLVEPARTLYLKKMVARVGHTEEYMARLEEGQPEHASKRFRPIPTEAAAGQAERSLRGGRKRPVRPSAVITRLGDLAVKGGQHRSRKANNARAIRGAVRSGRRLALLDLGRGKGIYRVMGRRKKLRIVKLYDVSRRVTPMPRIPTLEPAFDVACTKAIGVMHEALTRQLARAFGG